MSLLATIQEQLQHVDELVAQLERTAAEHPKPSVFANIRSLEKERRMLQQNFDSAAASAKVDVCRYRVVNKEPATVDGLTDVWRHFQDALSVVYYSLRGIPIEAPRVSKKRGRKPKAPTVSELPALQLGFGYTFPGSVGVAFTLPSEEPGGLFENDTLLNAASTIFDFAKSYQDTETIHKFARQLGPAPVEAMYRWANSHIVHHYGVGIDWQRNGEIKSHVLLQYEEFNVLSEELAKTTVEERIEVVGSLVAVDTLRRTFQINADTGEQYVGAFDDAITSDHVARVPWRYKAHVVHSVKVIPDESDKENYFLLALDDLD